VRGGATLGATVAALLLLAASALGHPERPTFYPDPGQGTFPEHRKSGPARVVCKPDSQRRIVRRVKNRKLRARNLKLLRTCRYRHIQEAVNAARNGDRILILPGVYNEEPSRAVPNPDPRCRNMYVLAASGSRNTPTYEYEVNCPNSRQTIAILGDSLADPDRRCDSKCNLQIEGTGDDRGDVLIVGDRRKENVIKADRADGIYLANFTIQYSDYNNVYVLETDGFRFRNIESRWSEEYGFLSFASDHGIYEHLEAYGSGDSGVYPGSGPETHGSRYGIKLRYNDIHHNLQGNAGAAGNGLWYHKNKFHHNGIGIVVDSFSAGHPGMPQDSSKFSHNEIYSNNEDYFTPERDEYCKKPPLERDPKVVCPAIMVPIGTGILIAGGNDNITADNRIWDNWRNGVMQIWVEAHFRGESEPEKQTDTSNGNRYLNNHMGAAPNGARAPNGTDFWWDEQGAGNCWMGNAGLGAGGAVTSSPAALPECPGSEVKRAVNPAKHAFLVPCATWDPYDNTDPPGCDWMTLPPKPE
jgi:hypothetical protein